MTATLAAAAFAVPRVVSSSSSLPPERRGQLRNGNRPGDFLAARRCCARTRSHGACRQPAMANGRCRMHGGMSTGPRTPAGRERCRHARLTHGARSAALVALVREARACNRRIATLRAAMNGRRPAGTPARPAGHGVHRPFSPSPVGARGARPPSSPTAPTPESERPAHPRATTPGSARLSTPAVSHLPPAGHGVLRSFFRFARRLVRPCLGGGPVYSPRPHNLAGPRAHDGVG